MFTTITVYNSLNLTVTESFCGDIVDLIFAIEACILWKEKKLQRRFLCFPFVTLGLNDRQRLLNCTHSHHHRITVKEAERRSANSHVHVFWANRKFLNNGPTKQQQTNMNDTANHSYEASKGIAENPKTKSRWEWIDCESKRLLRLVKQKTKKAFALASQRRKTT